MGHKNQSRFIELNKLISIGLPIILIVVIVIIVQLYENMPENTSTSSQPSNTIPSNTSDQQSNTISSKPTSGRHITIDLNESLSVTSR